MPMAQVNTRIDEKVKERGDATLAQAGYTPSRAIRAVWEFAASHAHEPDVVREFLQQAEGASNAAGEADVQEKLKALERGLDLHEHLKAAVGAGDPSGQDPPDRELRGAALLERWEERGLL